ncbi:efflux RND transporter periplasmic adaptor subunit [Fusobacterium varium]|uniref:efflux RND transporter periplasmic adaptor subunit n=1 Tax=Fusobacterium varium TaxID=856 RepID=UPI0030CB503F
MLELTDASTEASYYEAEGNLLKAKSSYSTDKISYEKYKKLYAKELVSEDEYLNSKNKYETSIGGLKIAEANFIRAKDNFSRLKVTAKIDGTITDLDLKEFEKVSASQKILTIVDNSNMELVIAVSGKDTEYTKVGGKAEVFVEELGEKLEGTITDINLSSDSNTKKYSVKIIVNNENQRLLKGLYAKVKLQQGYIKGLFVPKQAIMIKDLYSYIVISRNNTAVIYKITPDITIGNEQRIEFPDYQIGDRVVVEGQYLLNNNDKIKEN